MPELPDVEVFASYLKSTALHKKINEVEVRSSKVLKGISGKTLLKKVTGHSFEEAKRHGKYVFVKLDGSQWMVLHFGMTGFLRYFSNNDQEPDHTRILFSFDNGYHLAYVNQRLLGSVGLVESPDTYINGKKSGPDALDISRKEFGDIMSGRGTVKTAFMNQKMMAGVGNIYADEILYQAKILPQRKKSSLDNGDIDRLFDAMRNVLLTAIERKADPNSFPDDYIIPHRSEGHDCPRCGGKVRKTKVSGRTTWYCPGCQE